MAGNGLLKTKSSREIVLAVVAGLALGFACMAGVLPLAATIVFLAVAACAVVFKGLYHHLILAGILLLPCVFIEPAPTDIILCAAIPLGLMSGAFKPAGPGKAMPFILMILAYFIACLPGMALSPEIASAIRYYLITFYLFLISLFVCMYARHDNIESLLRAFVLAAFISFLAGLAGYLGLFPGLLMADPFRAKGLFKDPNVFGPFFVPAIIVLMEDLKKRAIIKAPPFVHIVAIILFSLGVVLSFSRAAWINLGVSVLLYLALNIKAIHMVKLLCVAAVVIGALFATTGLIDVPKGESTSILGFLHERAGFQEYDIKRFEVQRAGFDLIGMNPVGYGPGQFENVIGKVTQERLSAHSLYIRIAVENGAAGFLFFFVALAGMLLFLYLKHHTGRKASAGNLFPTVSQQSPVTAGLKQRYWLSATGLSPSVVIAVLSGILVNSLVIDTLHWRHFWIFIGLGLYCLRESCKEVGKHG